MVNTIAISSDFFDAFMKLDRKAQDKVKHFFEKFINNPNLPGINKEPIDKIENKQIYSVRIDNDYRGIILEESSKKYHLLWVDKHDKSYDWEDRKTKVKLNDVMVLTSDYYKDNGVQNIIGKKLFSNISKKELFKLGVPLEYLDIVKQIPDRDAFQKIHNLFPDDVYAKLDWVSCEFKLRDIIALDKQNRKNLIEYIEKKVTSPALKNEKLSDEIKKRIENTVERIKKNMDTTQKVIDFVNDALDSKSGKEIYYELKKLNLQGFEDIKDDLKRFGL